MISSQVRNFGHNSTVLDFLLNRAINLDFAVPLKTFSLIWSRHHDRRRSSNFDLYSALMDIEQ